MWLLAQVCLVVLAIAAFPAFAGDTEDGVTFLQNKDYTSALNSFRKAASRGDAIAQYNLALMYDKGQGVSQSYKEALSWYAKAAAQGLAQAQFNLGALYDDGQGLGVAR